MDNQNSHDTYIIPPDFVGTGTFFSGTFKVHSVIEAGILTFATGLPAFLFPPFGLTTRIIVPCLTALPLALLAFIGISGENLSSSLMIFPKFLKNRRVVGKETSSDTASPRLEKRKLEKQRRVRAVKSIKDHGAAKAQKSARGSMKKKRRILADSDFPAEFDEIREYKMKQKPRLRKGVKRKRIVKSKSDKQKHHGK